MVTILEVAVVLVVLALVVGAYRIVEAVEPFLWNAVVGLVVFFLAELLLGVSVGVGPVVLAVVAIGGVPGALLVILLGSLDIAFVQVTVALAL